MTSKNARDYIRSHVLGLVAIFIAITGTAVAGSNQTASESAVSNAKFKKLKQRVGAVEGTLRTPSSGDLTGTYPNLTIRPDAVTTAKIAPDAVTTAKIAPDAVTDAKLAADSVGSSELKTVSQPQSTLVNVVAGMENVATVTCGAGQQVLGGGGLWDSTDVDLRMLNSFSVTGNTWTMNGINQDGADHGIRAMASCLAP